MPISGVPDKISAAVKYSSDLHLLNEEHEGYVPDGKEDESLPQLNY